MRAARRNQACEVRLDGSEVSALVLRAAEPWSEASHELFPTAARAQAEALLQIGVVLARRWAAGQERSFLDAWREHAMPRLVGRCHRLIGGIKRALAPPP